MRMFGLDPGDELGVPSPYPNRRADAREWFPSADPGHNAEEAASWLRRSYPNVTPSKARPGASCGAAPLRTGGTVDQQWKESAAARRQIRRLLLAVEVALLDELEQALVRAVDAAIRDGYATGYADGEVRRAPVLPVAEPTGPVPIISRGRNNGDRLREF